MKLFFENLQVWGMLWLSFTCAIGCLFSIRNYFLRLLSLFGGRYNQNVLGQFIDWCWLSSAITLVWYIYK